MKRDPHRCPFCRRRSERVALGLSCYHCGRERDHLKIDPFILVLVVVISAAVGAGIARWLA